jgi:alkylation response protein AidB-like acyl-CoA dehydrogenase
MRDGTLLPPVRPLPAGAAELRSQVRGFLSAERAAGRFVPACRADGGWTVSGTKIWTSGAHRAHALIALLRTGPPDGRRRHVGLSQLLIELEQPGVTIRPIISMTGEHHFNEVVFDGASSRRG